MPLYALPCVGGLHVYTIVSVSICIAVCQCLSGHGQIVAMGWRRQRDSGGRLGGGSGSAALEAGSWRRQRCSGGRRGGSQTKRIVRRFFEKTRICAG